MYEILLYSSTTSVIQEVIQVRSKAKARIVESSMQKICSITLICALLGTGGTLGLKLKEGEGCDVASSNCTTPEICVEISPSWSQCVNCDNFMYSCSYWTVDVINASSIACGEKCPYKCDEQYTYPCDTAAGEKCVVATDDSWSQCIECENPSFQDSCAQWSPELRASTFPRAHFACTPARYSSRRCPVEHLIASFCLLPCLFGASCSRRGEGLPAKLPEPALHTG